MEGKKLYVNLIGIFIAIVCFFSMNVQALAANHKLVVEAVRCNTKDASGNDLNMSDQKVAANLYKTCLASYTENTAPAEYKLTNGSEVAPGSYVMFFVKYVHNGGTENTLSYSTFNVYDPNVWSIVNITGAGDIVMPGQSVNKKNANEQFPGEIDIFTDEVSVTWAVQAGSPKAGDIRFYGDDATDNRTLLNADVVLGHFFLKMNDNATAGSTTDLTFAKGSMLGNSSNQEITGTILENLSLSVAGAKQSSDASLKALTVKSNNISYPLDPAFVPGSLTPNEFNVIVPANVTTINVTAVPNDDNANVTTMTLNGGSISSNLNYGNNTVEITVTSQDPGVIKAYTVNVYRLSNVATLNSITFTNGISISGFNSGTKSYTINNVPYATKNTNITATLTDSKASIKSGDGSWNLTNHGSNVNTRNIVVEAENCKTEYASVTGNSCTTETYTINLNRIAPSTNKLLSSLSVNGTSVPSFNENTKTYTVSVPNNMTSVNVLGVVKDTGKASVTSGNGSHNINVGDNTINVVVTAEDQSTDTYTITVHRLNNDATLKTLTATSSPSGTFSPIFQGSFSGDYTYSIDATVANVDVRAEANDKTYATVGLTDTSSGATPIVGTGPTANATYPYTTKSVAAFVTAEDGTTKTYSLKFSRAQSSNVYLSGITVTNGSTTYPLTPTFNRIEKSYNVTVPSNISSVDITGTPEDNNTQIISGNGPHTLNFGPNNIEIRLKAENGQIGSYFVNVTRRESSDARLDTLTVDNTLVSGFNSDTETYTLDKVPYTKTSISIDGTFIDSYASFVSGNGTVNLNTGNNVLKVVTQAQDGTRKTYTLNIERAKNTDTDVKSIMVHEIPATKNSEGKYEVTLENNISTLAPSDVVILVGTDATITKPTNTIDLLTTSVNNYQFTVTAEDTSVVSTYELLITRKKSTDVSIGAVTLTLNDGATRSCSMSGDSCTIEVPVTTTGFNLNATIDSTSSIDPLNNTHFDMGPGESTKDIELTVTAEDGTTTKKYTVTVERQKSDNNDLRDLTVDGTTVSGFGANNTIYNISVPAATSSVTIGAVVEDTGKATIETDLSNPFDLKFGSNTINVVVKAENNRTKTYILNITREKGIDATLSDLRVNGTTVNNFSPNTDTYSLSSVDYNTVALNISATPNDVNASVSGTGASIPLHTGDNEIKIVVTAHDGKTTKEYKININRARNTDTGIKGITVANVPATKVDDENYTVIVPNNVTVADLTNVVVDVNDPKVSTDSKATYALDPTTLNLSTKVVNNLAIIVSSESGIAKTYSVAITREKSKVATLETLTVTNGSFSPSFKSDTFTYDVTVPVDAIGFDVDATKTDSESLINSGTGHYDMDQSTKQVLVVVVSEDGSVTNTYTLNVLRTKSSTNTLSNLTVSSGSDENKVTYPLTPEFTPEGTSYTVLVPGTVDSVDIDASLTDTRGRIEYGTGNHTIHVGTNPITLRVRSESNSPLDYTIIVERAKKTDAKLSDLTIDGVTIPNFDPNVFTYNIANSYPNSTTSINIGATTSDVDATVSGTGNKGLKTDKNTFDIVVTAEDGTTTETYQINVYRDKSANNNLAILSVNGLTLTPAFDPNVVDYEITVPEDKAELKPSEVSAIPDDSNAVATKDPTLTLLTTTDNYYSITVTAEDGQPKVYSIKVIRPKSTDAALKDVKLNGASLTPNFDPNIDTYTLNVPYGATSFDIEGIPKVATTEVFGNDTYNVADQRTITLTTRAEAGGTYTKTYTFNIVEALSNDATLTSLSVSGYPFKDPNGIFNSAVTTYDIGNIPYGTSELLINALATNPSSGLEYYVGANKQDSNRVTIPQVQGSNSVMVRVTAPDGLAKKDYIINYNIVLSDNAYLSTLNPSVGTLGFNKTNFEYILNVSNDVDTIDFDIITEDNNARITINGNTYATPKKITLTDLQVGNTPLSILVTAQDNNTTNTYNVVIKKAAPAASSDATLSSLSVDNYPFATNFDPNTEEYTIGSIPYNLDTLTINAVANVGASKITYFVNGTSQANNVVSIPKTNGNGEIKVRVVAQDGLTAKEYKIAYSKSASNNAFLSNITLNHGSITFDKTNQNYTIKVDADVESVDITAVAEDSNAVISANGTTYGATANITLTPINDGTNPINIVVTAEDGETSITYSLVFNKGDSVSDKITSVTYGHIIDSDYVRTVMVDTTVNELINNQLDNDAQYLEVWNVSDSAKVEDTENLATGMIVKLIINGEEKDRKTIVVVGDTNCDGKITMLDANIVVGHFTGENLMTGAVLVAGNTNYDDKITMLDANMIVGHFTNVSPITRPSAS